MQNRVCPAREFSFGNCTTALIVTISLLTCSGCQPNSPKSTTHETSPGGGRDSQSTAEKANASESHSATPPKLLDGWDGVQAVLLFSGDEHGYLEPCGCTGGQTGGFARRADLVKQIVNDRNLPVAGLNVGGLLRAERATYPQSKVKFRHMLAGLNEMGFQGVQLGLEELLLGPDALFNQHTQFESESDFHVPFIAENVTLFGTKELGTPIGSRVIEVGPIKVGVIGIVGQTTRRELEQTGLVTDENLLKIDLPEDVLREAIDTVTAESLDLLVLLSHSDVSESKSLAEKFPEFQVVVTANGAEDPNNTKPTYVGETLIVDVGQKGKNVTAVGVGSAPSLKWEVISLDEHRFKSDPEMVDLMQRYQDDLQANYAEIVSDDLAITHVTGNSFAGSDSCKECHSYAWGIWSKTKHSHAYESLIKGREDVKYAWASRVFDPECLCCHTTGWDAQAALRYDSGFFSMEKTPTLAGNQCENCHGPASKHVELETSWKATGGAPTAEIIDARLALRLLKSEAEQKVCKNCHDHDNSPRFNFEEYWPKVNHSGRKD